MGLRLKNRFSSLTEKDRDIPSNEDMEGLMERVLCGNNEVAVEDRGKGDRVEEDVSTSNIVDSFNSNYVPVKTKSYRKKERKKLNVLVRAKHGFEDACLMLMDSAR